MNFILDGGLGGIGGVFDLLNLFYFSTQLRHLKGSKKLKVDFHRKWCRNPPNPPFYYYFYHYI